jgi:hypothetical protein
MRTGSFVTGTIVAIVMAGGFGSTPLSAQSNGVNATPATSTTPVAVTQFAVLQGVQALPMASSELDAVKGLHVHFVTPSKNTQHFGMEGLQLAGDIKTENNWSNEWGGSDGIAVAPSYKGLCVATGLSGQGNSVIFIPGGLVQCPL